MGLRTLGIASAALALGAVTLFPISATAGDASVEQAIASCDEFAPDPCGTVAFVTGNPADLPDPDSVLVDALSAAGYDIELVDDDDVDPAFGDADIGIISSSVVPAKIPAGLGDSDVPMMNLEGFVSDELGLATRAGEQPTGNNFVIMNPDHAGHPLAAGLTGFQGVYRSDQPTMNFGEVGGDAIVIATTGGRPRQPSYYAYEAGSVLASGDVALGRRVAHFPTYSGPLALTATGVELFTASVAWLFEDPPPPVFEISAVSSRADTVTGGDVLVRIDVPDGVDPDGVEVTVDGRDISSAFGPAPGSASVLLGLVDGLADGENSIEVRGEALGTGEGSAELVVDNHPIIGPVFSGPHITMYCTAGGPPWNLGPTDADCHVEGPSVSYQYRTTGGSFAPLADPEGALPGDLATTTTTAGDEVPYIVRVERGTINRAVYESAILHDPAGDVPSPWNDTPGWNERLVYTFGGACGIGHHQGSSTGGVLNNTLLRQGYGVASATFNVFAQNCNDVTSAETAMMVKEHFIETYGVPDFTMGWGASAGTMQQLLISNAYPGILDGVVGNIGYPDERTTTISGHECRFIRNAFTALDGTPLAFDADQRQAVEGFAPATMPGFPYTCFGYQFFDNVDWPAACPNQIPPADRYDPVANPDGIRCAIADFVSNVYGTDPATGFGRPFVPDNVGVQYGLQALDDGAISVEQFLELNRLTGGIDIEGNPTAERAEADPIALERAYATGRVNQFDGGLRWTPIIETRQYRDFNADFHDKQRSYSMRARILQSNGDSFNHVSWTGPPAYDGVMQERALADMDAWLTARGELAAVQPGLDDVELTRMSKPDIADGCIDPNDGTWVDEPLTLDPDATCNTFFPYHENPRIAAGGPQANDITKCQLVTPDRGSYEAPFTDEQWQELVDIFDQGVCDWSQPGVGQVPLEDVWIQF